MVYEAHTQSAGPEQAGTYGNEASEENVRTDQYRLSEEQRGGTLYGYKIIHSYLSSLKHFILWNQLERSI